MGSASEHAQLTEALPAAAGRYRTDAENAQWRDDHRNLSRLILDHIEERIETMWEQQ